MNVRQAQLKEMVRAQALRIVAQCFDTLHSLLVVLLFPILFSLNMLTLVLQILRLIIAVDNTFLIATRVILIFIIVMNILHALHTF